MCLAIPGQIIGIIDEQRRTAKVEIGGVTRSVNVSLLDDEGAAPGDWVLVHVGFAISKIDEAEARATLELLDPSALTREAAEIVASGRP